MLFVKIEAGKYRLYPRLGFLRRIGVVVLDGRHLLVFTPPHDEHRREGLDIAIE